MRAVEVLMVEDNPGDVVLLREASKRASLDYRFAVVKDGIEAMDYLWHRGPYPGESDPDLIILDLKLPRKGGREVLEQIGREPRLRAIPVVILSSSVSELEMAKARALPALGYLVKPSTFSGYLALLESIEALRKAAVSPGEGGP